MFSLRDVRVVLGNRVALEADQLALGEGELIGLIGPNGSGKTTLLRLLAGLVSPQHGSIDRQAASVAYVPQRHDHHRWMPLTVDEVLRMGRYRDRGLLGRLKAHDQDLITTSAERLDIADLRRRPFGELSGGQRQRVLIASALATDAPCLLLDEPITGLDLPSQQLITEVAQSERDQGRLVVFSTHHLNEATTCDRVIVLATQIVADGPPADVLRPEPLARAFGSQVINIDELDGGVETRILLDDHGHAHGHATPSPG